MGREGWLWLREEQIEVLGCLVVNDCCCVNDEWTTLVTQAFCRFRRRMSEKNTSPGAEAEIDGDWVKTSLGINFIELQWLH